MSAADIAAAFTATQQPIRYAADKQTVESLLKNVREDPYDGLNHGVLADALDEVYGEHPLHEFIRAHGMNGAETPNLWNDAYQAGYDGTFPGYVSVGEKNGFRFLLGHEGGSRNKNGRWTVFAQPWKVKNRQLRDDAYAMEFESSEHLKHFADAAGLPAIHQHADGDPDEFIARHEDHYEGRPQQLQRQSQPIRYAKAKRRRVHPLLRGTRLAVVLKEIAKDKSRPETAAFVKGILFDEHGPTRFAQFADHLQDTDHPLFGHYNWPAIGVKLLHDAETIQIVKRLAKVEQTATHSLLGGERPRLLHSANGVLHDARDTIGLGFGNSVEARVVQRYGGEPPFGLLRRQTLDRIHSHLKSKFPEITFRHVAESLDRVHHRISRQMQIENPNLRDFYLKHEKTVALSPLDEQIARIEAAHKRFNPVPTFEKGHEKELEKQKETSLRYERPVVGGVKNALRLMQSRNQQQYRSVAADVLKRLGLSPSKVRDGVTLSGAPVASVVAAIYHGGDSGRAEAAAAYFGHLMQLPSVTTFHADDSGSDSLYKLTLPMAPAAAAQHLQRHGVVRCVLVPSRAGTDVLIHDPGRRQAAAVASAAQGGEVQETVGRSVRLGHADGHRADANSRRSYRQVISQFEEAANGSRQQPAADGNSPSPRAAADAAATAAVRD